MPVLLLIHFNNRIKLSGFIIVHPGFLGSFNPNYVFLIVIQFIDQLDYMSCGLGMLVFSFYLCFLTTFIMNTI